MNWRNSWGGWPEYVPVAQRRAQAEKRAARQAERAGRKPEPVRIAGRGIATTFWGRSWCQHMEGCAELHNRLVRGRTYVRNGSVVDLCITKSRIEAVVAGSRAYDVKIAISSLSPTTWRAIKSDCATSIGSVLELLTGQLSDHVMRRLTQPREGMFPSPRQLSLACSCPDGIGLCKHLAAVLYGVGNRLDTKPELLFLLRGVDQGELVAAATKASVVPAASGTTAHALAADDLSAIFGIDLGTEKPPQAEPPKRRLTAAARPSKQLATTKRQERKTKPQTRRAKKAAVKKAAVKKATAKKATAKKATATTRPPRPAAKQSRRKKPEPRLRRENAVERQTRALAACAR